jgi:hypothetical protein
MYKKFFMGIAAMAVLTLVSCSSDDLNSLSDNSSKNEAISFDGYLGRSAVAVNGSRASVLDNTALQPKGFGVFGNYSPTEGTGIAPTYGNNWFDNQQVTYDTKWTYTPLKYWLPKGHIDFLAYAPYNAGTVKDPYSIDFKVSSTIADQIDLLWAHADNQTKANKPVTFNFNHALAKIGYTVKTNVEGTGTTITLKKITLAGSTTDPKKEAFYTEGTIDLSKPNGTDLWTTSTFPGRQNFEWYNGTYNGVTTSPTHPNDNRAEDKDYLFVIPQNFEPGKDDLYVIVEYTINYKLGKPGTIETMDYTVSSKIEKNFEQGKAYKINLNIGLTPIEFNATVNAWPINDKIINYDIPLN